jgi:hypothetical protein
VILTEGRLRYAGPLAELAAESSLEAEFLRLTTGALDGAG